MFMDSKLILLKLILLKAIYRFNAIPYQEVQLHFYRNRKNNAKICMEPQKLQRAKAILRKNKAGASHFLI